MSNINIIICIYNTFNNFFLSFTSSYCINSFRLRSKSKRHEDKSIFYDIFIKPKENKIKELRIKKNESSLVAENKIESEKAKNKIFISNKVVQLDSYEVKDKNFPEKETKEKEANENNNLNTYNLNIKDTYQFTGTRQNKNHNTQKTSETYVNLNSSTGSFKFNHNRQESKNPTKIFLKSEENNPMKHNLSSFLKCENEEETKYINILTNFLNSKFIPRDDASISKKNFFNQLIQIQPPEGINAAVTAPIDASKGWAPSIPAVQVDKNKTNLGDLIMRAKGGIQAGDIPKEAHMAFYLGIMNEEGKNYEEALKFYKKYFLSTKILQDIYGMELALNRIGVLYANMLDFNQSLYYHEKHRNITTHNIKGFVAYYNSGVCQRMLGKIDESIKSFDKALQISEEENVCNTIKYEYLFN